MTKKKTASDKSFFEVFHFEDWLLDKGLARSHPTSRGIWFDLLCHMWRERTSFVEGTVEDIMSIGRGWDLETTLLGIADLSIKKVADVTVNGDPGDEVLKPLSRFLSRLCPGVSENVPRFSGPLVPEMSRLLSPDCPAIVRLTNRRLDRRIKSLDYEKNRKRRLRGKDSVPPLSRKSPGPRPEDVPSDVPEMSRDYIYNLKSIKSEDALSRSKNEVKKEEKKEPPARPQKEQKKGNGEDPEIKKFILSVQALGMKYDKKKINIWQWMTKAFKSKLHPESIRFALEQGLLYQDKAKNLWSYLDSIVNKESGNFFERTAISEHEKLKEDFGKIVAALESSFKSGGFLKGID